MRVFRDHKQSGLLEIGKDTMPWCPLQSNGQQLVQCRKSCIWYDEEEVGKGKGAKTIAHCHGHLLGEIQK